MWLKPRVLARHAPFKLLLKSAIVIGARIVGADRILSMDVGVEIQHRRLTIFVHNRQRPALRDIACRHPHVGHADATDVRCSEVLRGQTICRFVTMCDHNASFSGTELAVETPQSKHQATANKAV